MTPTVRRQRVFGKRDSDELFRGLSRRLLGLLVIAVLAIAMGPRGACPSNTHDHHHCDEAATPLCCECGAIPRPVTVEVDPPVEVASPVLAANDLAPAALTFSPEPPPPKR
jgi:hypothetical protein